VDNFLEREQAIQPAAELSSRERGILQLFAEGYSSKEIAEKLTLSLHTIHVHKNNIMKKLNIHRQTELVKYALKEGIIQV
jgi:DNA-binding NarL/FixJ family response regulator